MKRVWVLMLLLVLALGASACAGDKNAGDGQADPGGSADQLPEHLTRPVELVFYNISRDSEESFNERFGNALREKFPNLTVKYIQRVANENDLAQIVVSGDRFDLIWGSIGSWPAVLDFEVAHDMEDLIRKHQVDLSVFEPTLIDAVKQLGGGKIYGLPFENSTRAIYYNKAHFEEFGVSEPTDGMTWSELHDMSRRLNRVVEDKVYSGFSPSINHIFLMNAYSLPLIDPQTGKSAINTDLWRKVINTEFLQFAAAPTYQQVADKYRNGGVPNLNTFIKDYALAMYTEGPLLPIVLPEEMSRFEWDIVAMPTYEDQKGVGYQPYPSYMSVAAHSPEKDMAMEAIKFFISSEFQTNMSKSGNMTALQDESIQKLLGSESAFADKNFGAFFYNEFAPVQPKSEYDSKVNPYSYVTGKFMAIATGQTDLNTVLREAEEDVNNKIEALKRQ